MTQNHLDLNINPKYLFSLGIDRLFDTMDQLTFIFMHFLKIHKYGIEHLKVFHLKYESKFH